MRRGFIVAALLTCTACAGPTSPTQPQPTSAPFVLPSALVGDWTGTDGRGKPATLHGDGVYLSGTADGRPLVLRDSGLLIIDTCQTHWDQVWRTEDGFAFFAGNRFCAGEDGHFTFTRKTP